MIIQKEDNEIVGEIIDLEHSSYWGCEVGHVECPNCKMLVQFGGMAQSVCDCRYEWTVEVVAVGRINGN